MKRMMSIADLLAVMGPQANDAFARTLLRHLTPTPGDQAFNEALPVTLAASAVRQVVVQWPQAGQEQSNMGRLAIVDAVAMGTATLADLDNIVWSITVDGSAWLGFDFIQGPFGVFIYPKPVLIPLLPGSVVAITATNLTALAIPNVTGYLMGRSFMTEGDPTA